MKLPAHGATALALVFGLTAGASGAAGQASEREQYFLDAAMDGELELVQKLLDEGVDVDAVYDEEDGTTALMQAAGGGHGEIVEVLLAAGAKREQGIG